MTSIEKLLVQGIRSFDPNESSVIDFYKPLTLIVGVNGAGKTTIIECLKYASTGEMPPNCSSGQAFIHDPKIAGNSEVKAQIKMRFKNPNGKPIVATRSLSLIQRANNKQEFRQMDASLQSFNSEGQKVSKSFRCSDLDKEIPELMGVAKPILKNVIFCHQEESHWPLSESSKLKIKFDEIFSAVRYTKALKSIKDKKKEVTSQLKETRLKLEVVTNNRDHSIRFQKEILSMEQQLNTLNTTLRQTGLQLKEKRQQFEKIFEKMKQVETVAAEVKAMEARRLEMERNKDRLYQTLTETFEEPDEELIFMTNSFNEEVENMLKAEQELSENLQKLQRDRESLASKKNSNSIEIGRIEQQLRMTEEIAANRDKQLAELTSRYNLPNDGTNPEETLIALTMKLSEISATIESNQESFKCQLSTLETQVSNSRIEKKQIEERINQQQSQKQANQRKLDQIEVEKKNVLSLSEHVAHCHQSIADAERLIEQLEVEFKSQSFEVKLKELAQNRIDLDNRMEQHRQAMSKANQFAVQRSSIIGKQTDLTNKQKEIEDYLSNNQKTLNELLLDDVYSTENLSEKLELAISRIDSEHIMKKQEIDEINSQIMQNENELKSIQQDLQNKSKQQHDLDLKLSQLDESDRNDLDKSIEITSKLLHDLEKSIAILESEDVLYKEYIETANNKSECSLCSNQMEGDGLHSFIHRLESHTDGIPKKLDDLAHQLKTANDKHKQLTQAKPLYDILANLNQEIPNLEKRESEISYTITNCLAPIKKTLVENITSLDFKLKQANQMRVVASSINLLHQETRKMMTIIEKEEQQYKLDSGSSIDNNSSTLEELNQQYEQMKLNLQENQTLSQQLTDSSKNNRNELYKQQQIVMSSRETLSKASGQTEIVDHLRKSEKEIHSTNEEIDVKITEFSGQLVILEKRLEEETASLDNLRTQIDMKSAGLSKEKSIFGNKLAAIKNLQLQIPGDISEIVKKMESLSQDSKDIDANINSINDDYVRGTAHIDQIKNDLAQSEITKRVINDNLQYRQQKLNCDQLAIQITKKSASITSIVSNEEQELYKNIQAEITTLRSKIDNSSGQVEAVEQHIRVTKSELAKPIYKDVDTVYRDLLVNAETIELVNKDLDKYYKALDKALMKYHVLKMDEINKTIRELWTATYRGNDIDTIEIRSEESTTAKKVINYRVVMIKGDVELDMRGRCSAGQKVLACLVIRLALAENFCTNCGILALDEPTSNLDRANIESFATALLNIIEAKKNQNGFQLIIITHDEEFVQYLSRGNFTDYYWRVTKDANQHSLVERKEISTI